MAFRFDTVLATDYPGSFNSDKLKFYEELRESLKTEYGKSRELFVPPVDFPKLSPYLENLLGRKLDSNEIMSYFFEVVVIQSKLVLYYREQDPGFSDSIVRRAINFKIPVIGFHKQGIKSIEKDLFLGLETVVLKGDMDSFLEIERRVRNFQ